MDPFEDGPGPRVEDPAAASALIIQDRMTMTSVDAQTSLLSTVWACQPIGMEDRQELVVARILVHVIH